jgi:sugar/nucleoside kinase (ribokinase family)
VSRAVLDYAADLPQIGRTPDGRTHIDVEADKQDRESVVPMPAELVREIRSFQRALAGPGGLYFPMLTDESKPMRRDTFDKALRRDQRRAKLKPLDGGLWHACRRSWATARKHLPVHDVVLAVMSEPTKVHEISGARNG